MTKSVPSERGRLNDAVLRALALAVAWSCHHCSCAGVGPTARLDRFVPSGAGGRSRADARPHHRPAHRKVRATHPHRATAVTVDAELTTAARAMAPCPPPPPPQASKPPDRPPPHFAVGDVGCGRPLNLGEEERDRI